MQQNEQGRVVKIAGPLVLAKGLRRANLFDVVRVSDRGLIGEIIEMHGEEAYIQVYEETSGLSVGEPVFSEGRPLAMELGPGLVGGIFDGIGRPLTALYQASGSRLHRGQQAPPLDRAKTWAFCPCVEAGQRIQPGDVLGTVQETPLVLHRIMAPPGVFGVVEQIRAGKWTVDEPICTIQGKDGVRTLSMCQAWPVRRARPVAKKLAPDRPLITGQRVIDCLFPLAKGGVAAIPGPFGSGKTVTQHQLAKWAEADIVVYIGCGERGNEMTDVLNEFPALTDPKTGRPLMERTVLIANTSDMPVAAREASIYTGVTIAEYFRDMGYSVALMADSTSRWAEALREMSGRLEEMPGEEGYPAYLGSRLAQFYERAGRALSIGTTPREGALSIIGAVSPPGGDIAEPVSQATLRIVKVFWGLDAALAYKRHFPAIHYLTSYSLYADELAPWFEQEVHPGWGAARRRMLSLLSEEAELEEVVKLVGMDAIAPQDRIKMETARSIREDFLHQVAFDEVDTYTSLAKQWRMMQLILAYYDGALAAAEQGAEVERLAALPVREDIARYKRVPEEKSQEEATRILADLQRQLADAVPKEER